MMFIPRPKQAEVLAYTGGKMGVSAVPGSGKTQTLSALAAKLVAEGMLDDDQEVLIVTLVNSAVDNFARRVDGFVQERGLLPHVGYRVRTLHGLAHDIVRERPDLVGLANDFSIVDERDATRILQEAAEAWIAAHPDAADQWLNPDLDERKRDWVRRDHWPKLVATLGGNFIRLAKDLELTPALLRERINSLSGLSPEVDPLTPDSRSLIPGPWSLLDLGLAIYTDYQRALSYRGAVDYDDLIRLALEALQLDGEYLKRLQARWPFILEDEAQDSSRLQEKILRLLAGYPAPSSGHTAGVELVETLAGPSTSSGRGGCASVTPTRRSSRPSPQPALNTCASSCTRQAWPRATCPTRAARRRASWTWRTISLCGAARSIRCRRCTMRWRRRRSCPHRRATRSPTRPTTLPPSA